MKVHVQCEQHGLAGQARDHSASRAQYLTCDEDNPGKVKALYAVDAEVLNVQALRLIT